MWILYIVPPLFFLVGFIILFEAILFRKLSTTRDGRVVGFEKQKGSKGNETLRPIVVYKDADTTYRFLGGIGSMPPAYEIGEHVTVMLYKKLQGTARIKSKGRIFIATAFMTLGAVGSLIALLQTKNTLLVLSIYLLLFIIALYFVVKALDVIWKKQHTKWQRQYETTPNEQDEDKQDKIVGYTPSESAILNDSGMQQYQVSIKWHYFSLILGLLILLASLYWGYNIKTFMQTTPAVIGKIVAKDVQTSSSSNGSSTHSVHAIIEYTTLTGEQRRYTSKYGATHPSWSIGDTITVHYDPKNGYKAMEESSWNYIFPAIGTFLGVLMLLLSLRKIKKQKK